MPENITPPADTGGVSSAPAAEPAAAPSAAPSTGSEQGYGQDQFGHPTGFRDKPFNFTDAFYTGAGVNPDGEMGQPQAMPPLPGQPGAPGPGAPGQPGQPAAAAAPTGIPEGWTAEDLAYAQNMMPVMRMMRQTGFESADQVLGKLTQQQQDSLLQEQVQGLLQKENQTIYQDLQARVDNDQISPEAAQEIYNLRMEQAQGRAEQQARQALSARANALQQTRTGIKNLATTSYPALAAAGDAGIDHVLAFANHNNVPIEQATAQVAQLLAAQRQQAVADYAAKSGQQQQQTPPVMGAGGQGAGQSQTRPPSMRASWHDLIPWMRPAH